MKHTPNADTRSPWYEAFAPAAEAPAARWVPGTQFPADKAKAAEAAVGGGQEAQPATEETWATEALFDYYNG